MTTFRISDRDLLQRFAEHDDDAAFTELIHRYGPLVTGVARRILNSHSQAEDVAQAVFLTLAQQADKLDQVRSLGAWLCRVTTRAALNSRRGEIRRVTREQKAMDEQRERHHDQFRDRYDDLYSELDELPDKYRLPLILHHLQGAPQHEAAAELGIKRDAFAKRICRAREKLRKRLTRTGIVLMPIVLTELLDGTLQASELSSATVAQLGAASQAGAVSPAAAELAAQATGTGSGVLMNKLLATAAVLLTGVAVVSTMIEKEAPELQVHRQGYVKLGEQIVSHGLAMNERYSAVGMPARNEVRTFVLRNGEWLADQTIRGKATTQFSGIGRENTIAIDGERLVIGHPYRLDGRKQRGFIQIYERADDKWHLTQEIAADNEKHLGVAIALQGDRLVAAHANGLNIYELQNEWRLVQQVETGSPKGNLALDGDSLAVVLRDQNLVSVYAHRNGSFQEDGSIHLQNRSLRGTALALKRGILAVGHSAAKQGEPGQVAIFERGDNGWTRQQILRSGATMRDSFGHALTLADDTLLVASPRLSTEGKVPLRGAFFVYQRRGAEWQRVCGPVFSGRERAEQMTICLTTNGDWIQASTANGNRDRIFFFKLSAKTDPEPAQGGEVAHIDAPH